MNAIVYLVDSDDTENFKKSLSMLHNINIVGPCPILAFHERSLYGQRELMNTLDAAYDIQFIEIEFSIPDYSPHIRDSIPENFIGPNGCPFPMGYRHMCRFFSGELFKHPALAPYRYILRLDTDSTILGPLEDIFERMANEKADYGYRMISRDYPSCYVGFYDAFKAASGVSGNNWDGELYGSNFEVIDLDCFRANHYLSVYDLMDKTGGFLLHRWGDHIMRFIYLTAFGKKAIHFDFDYGHAGKVWLKGEPK